MNSTEVLSQSVDNLSPQDDTFKSSPTAPLIDQILDPTIMSPRSIEADPNTLVIPNNDLNQNLIFDGDQSVTQMTQHQVTQNHSTSPFPTSPNSSSISPNAATRGDLKRLAALSREQQDRLSLLNNRIERLRTQEQKCWKDISLTQKRSEVLEQGEAAREKKLEIQATIYEQGLLEQEQKREQTQHIKAVLSAEKDTGKNRLLEQNSAAASETRESTLLGEYEVHVRKLQELQIHQESVKTTQYERERLKQELKRRKELEISKVQGQKLLRFNEMMDRNQELQKQICKAEREEEAALYRLQKSQNMRDSFVRQCNESYTSMNSNTVISDSNHHNDNNVTSSNTSSYNRRNQSQKKQQTNRSLVLGNIEEHLRLNHMRSNNQNLNVNDMIPLSARIHRAKRDLGRKGPAFGGPGVPGTISSRNSLKSSAYSSLMTSPEPGPGSGDFNRNGRNGPPPLALKKNLYSNTNKQHFRPPLRACSVDRGSNLDNYNISSGPGATPRLFFSDTPTLHAQNNMNNHMISHARQELKKNIPVRGKAFPVGAGRGYLKGKSITSSKIQSSQIQDQNNRIVTSKGNTSTSAGLTTTTTDSNVSSKNQDQTTVPKSKSLVTGKAKAKTITTKFAKIGQGVGVRETSLANKARAAAAKQEKTDVLVAQQQIEYFQRHQKKQSQQLRNAATVTNTNDSNLKLSGPGYQNHIHDQNRVLASQNSNKAGQGQVQSQGSLESLMLSESDASLVLNTEQQQQNPVLQSKSDQQRQVQNGPIQLQKVAPNNSSSISSSEVPIAMEVINVTEKFQAPLGVTNVISNGHSPIDEGHVITSDEVSYHQNVQTRSHQPARVPVTRLQNQIHTNNIHSNITTLNSNRPNQNAYQVQQQSNFKQQQVQHGNISENDNDSNGPGSGSQYATRYVCARPKQSPMDASPDPHQISPMPKMMTNNNSLKSKNQSGNGIRRLSSGTQTVGKESCKVQEKKNQDSESKGQDINQIPQPLFFKEQGLDEINSVVVNDVTDSIITDSDTITNQKANPLQDTEKNIIVSTTNTVTGPPTNSKLYTNTSNSLNNAKSNHNSSVSLSVNGPQGHGAMTPRLSASWSQPNYIQCNTKTSSGNSGVTTVVTKNVTKNPILPFGKLICPALLQTNMICNTGNMSPRGSTIVSRTVTHIQGPSTSTQIGGSLQERSCQSLLDLNQNNMNNIAINSPTHSNTLLHTVTGSPRSSNITNNTNALQLGPKQPSVKSLPNSPSVGSLSPRHNMSNNNVNIVSCPGPQSGLAGAGSHSVNSVKTTTVRSYQTRFLTAQSIHNKITPNAHGIHTHNNSLSESENQILDQTQNLKQEYIQSPSVSHDETISNQNLDSGTGYFSKNSNVSKG